MKVILKTLRLENFKSVVDKTYDFGDITRINGMNRLGKTTIGTAIFWLFSDKGYELNSNPNIRPDDGRECVPTVTATLDIDGKEVVISKMQKQKVGKPDENGVSKVTLSNSYEINSVPKTNRDFVAYMEELGFDFDKFLVCSHPDVFTKDFNQKKKQDEMREHLFAMANSKSDLEIAKMSKETAEVAKLLESYKFEEIEAMNKASKKKASEQLDAIPNQIIGLEKAKVDVDVAEQELLKADLEWKIEAVDDRMENAGTEIGRLRGKEMQLQFDMSGIMQVMNDELSAKRRGLDSAKDDATREFNDLHNQIQSAENQIKANEKAISDTDAERKNLGVEYNAEFSKAFDEMPYIFDESKWKLGESTTVCSLCGQKLPQDKIESLKADFEQKKADAKARATKQLEDARKAFDDAKGAKLKGLIDKGNACKDDIERLTKENAKLQEDIVALKEQESKALAKQNDYAKQLSEIPAEADYSQNEEYVKLKAEHNKVFAELAKTDSLCHDELMFQLEEEKADLQSQLDEVNKIIAQAENNVRIDEQISEMQAKQTEYAQVKADAENILNQLSEVSKRKNNLLVDEINSHFSIVKWKLYDYQKNGEYKEVCTPTVPDEKTGIYKVFGDTTNKGREIEAKLDICDSFQKFYGMRVPIVLDNAESINDEYIPKVDTQLILLTVTKDKDLKVEVL